jgi:hypothetical protein
VASWDLVDAGLSSIGTILKRLGQAS